MQLSEYLRQHEISRGRFAELIGVKEVTVGRYITGARFPDRDSLIAIKRVTGGAVTADDFLPAEPSPSNGEGEPTGAAA